MPDTLFARGSHMSLPTLLYVAESESWSGTVHIQPSGRLVLREGCVLSAAATRFQGREALYELFIDRPETVRYEAHEVDAAAPALGQTGALMFEGVRRADEWLRLGDRTLACRAALPDGLSPTLRRALERLDGTCTLRQATASLVVARSTLIDHVVRLVDDGVLSEVREGDPSARAQGSQAPTVEGEALQYFQAMEDGRTALREGRLEDGLRAFERALATRPGDRLATRGLARAHSLLAGA